MTITLDAIKAEQTKIAEMIAAFERQAGEVTKIHFPEALIALQHGEHYAGLIVGSDATRAYHLILLPEDADKNTWSDARAWAEERGGVLPTSSEQSLLRANLKDQFQPHLYWSSDQSEEHNFYVWVKNFYNGSQHCNHQSNEYRARAVRRLIIANEK